MKPSKIIEKLKNQIESNTTLLLELLDELDESLNENSEKIKKNIFKKISKSFNLDNELLLKKILKYKKELSDESVNILSESDIVPVYKQIIYNDEEYYYDNNNLNGIVIKNLESNPIIVGYMGENNTIIFN